MASTSRARLDPDAAVGLSREDRAALEPLRRSMENFAFVSFARALGGELGFPDFTPAQLGARASCKRPGLRVAASRGGRCAPGSGYACLRRFDI